jgi:hypothetical protein
MHVTPEQREALERGEPVPIEVDEMEKECVLIERAAYERMRHLLNQLDEWVRHSPPEEIDPSFFEFDEQVVEAAVRQFVERSSRGAAPATQPRQGGYWRGRVVIADDFDELPPDLEEAFGLTGP